MTTQVKNEIQFYEELKKYLEHLDINTSDSDHIPTVPERIYDYPKLTLHNMSNILITKLVNAGICIDTYPTYIICKATPEKVLHALGNTLRGDYVARIYRHKEDKNSKYQTRVGIVKSGGCGEPRNYICDIVSSEQGLTISDTHPLHKDMKYGTAGTTILRSATIALGIRSNDLTPIGLRSFRVNNYGLDSKVATSIINSLRPYGWQLKAEPGKQGEVTIHISEAPSDDFDCDLSD
jgi:hypothetical protein